VEKGANASDLNVGLSEKVVRNFFLPESVVRTAKFGVKNADFGKNFRQN